MGAADVVLVYITTSDIEEARRIARLLVDERLAACANLVTGVQSIYWWDGKVCDESEALVLAKTKKALVEKVVVAVKEAHSYDVPDIAVIDVVAGYEPYFEWVNKETRSVG